MVNSNMDFYVFYILSWLLKLFNFLNWAKQRIAKIKPSCYEEVYLTC